MDTRPDFRAAILQAAEYIESDPDNFVFMEFKVPTQCGAPGCALGWIGHFAGLQGDANTVALAMGYPESDDRADIAFYRALEAVGTHQDLDWQYSPKVCAKLLRRYAAAHYPILDPRTA